VNANNAVGGSSSSMLDSSHSSSTSTVLLSASNFLSPTATHNGYCSFVLQDDSNRAISNFTKHHVTHPILPLIANNDLEKQLIADTICIADPYWLFIGRNNNPHGMKGREEHTDSIDHNGGTYHYQVAGSKIWTIRPTEELREMCDEIDIALKGSYVITVEEGDIFVMNTRLWWHQTEIPGTTTTFPCDDNGDSDSKSRGVMMESSSNGCTSSNLSISYARDIYLDGTKPTVGRMHMSTLSGSWATAFIPKGTLFLTEADPPIGRTFNEMEANCELVVGEEKCELVVIRDIKEGEFYVMLESDDTATSDEEE